MYLSMAMGSLPTAVRGLLKDAAILPLCGGLQQKRCKNKQKRSQRKWKNILLLKEKVQVLVVVLFFGQGVRQNRSKIPILYTTPRTLLTNNNKKMLQHTMNGGNIFVWNV